MDGNGILLNSFGDVDEIETALNSFLDLPESEKQTMSHRSEQVVKERASLENMANQHVRAIEHVIGKMGGDQNY
jgi:glycosyltransferase involved in cell wall biosynthesis